MKDSSSSSTLLGLDASNLAYRLSMIDCSCFLCCASSSTCRCKDCRCLSSCFCFLGVVALVFSVYVLLRSVVYRVLFAVHVQIVLLLIDVLFRVVLGRTTVNW